MGIRGRESAASLTVIGIGGIESVKRPDAPQELSAEQAAEWDAVVNRLPADWFPRETLPMLSQYCRHVVAARHIGQLIAAAESGDELDLAKYDLLLRMQEREGRALSSLATRMRMTQQATYDPKRKKPTQEKPPWQQ